MSHPARHPAPPGGAAPRGGARRSLARLLLSAALAGLPAAGARADSTNVSWTFRDSVAACPAGDSLGSGHPGRLRIEVAYFQRPGGLPAPRAGAPPESVWVAWSPLSGSAAVNDQPGRAFADDSTDAAGRTRITVPSFSGCGSIALTLWVAGAPQGSALLAVRSADSDLDGRVSGADAPCDLDWDGDVDAADAALAAAHAGHSHRQRMFGTLERRTNLADPSFPIGESTISWSPDGRSIAFTIHTEPNSDCAVFLVPSDAEHGNAPVRFTFPEAGVHDYDPSWSPLGTEIAFGRNDNAIFVKGVPGLAADTSLRLVTRHNDGTWLERGDLMPAISPEGEWVAFTRKSTAAGHYEIWKTPVNGDTTRRAQLVFDGAGDDFYPQWSPDGEWVLYQRLVSGEHGVWKVPAAGGTPLPVIAPGGGLWASAPSLSPDGAVLLAGVGPPDAAATGAWMVAEGGATLPDARLVPSFPEFTRAGAYPGVTPRLSPDGTRLAVVAGDVYAARRNTSLPPVIAAVAGQPVDRRAPVVNLVAQSGLPLAFQVEASDPEGDAIEFRADFLRDGMAFDGGTRTFSWTPSPAAVGTTSNVRFGVSTASGGSDYAIARVAVTAPTGVPGPAAVTSFRVAQGEPNPFRERVTIAFELPEALPVRVEVFDLAGRRLRVLAEGRLDAGRRTVEWDGRDAAGRGAPAGLYLCRVSAGPWSAQRKMVRTGP